MTAPTPDVYLVAAEAVEKVLHTQIPNHAEMVAHFDWFIAAVDAFRHPLPVTVAPIAILPPVVLKQSVAS